MKRIGIYAAFALVVFFTGCASKALVCDNNWQDKPITVDGKANEWETPLRYYNEDTKLNYTLTNDDSNLYYCIRITDDREENRILSAGMQVWIDTSGNKAKQIGIQYPYDQMKTKTSSDSSKITSANNHSSGYAKEMRLSGFIPPIGGSMQVPNMYGINVAISKDASGVMIYEGCIPFKTFYKAKLTAADKDKIFGITIILNAMESAQKKENHGGHPTNGALPGMPGGMGGTGAMGPMGASMSGGGGGRRSNSEETEEIGTHVSTLYLRIKLASKAT
ncbi:MAG TPA: hypothetical protein VNZ45_08730 [Bacteroidia bacterium]|jgi:hypothetical protein|nr:hypothetical protein [Bacteroidia bacterium]